MSLLENYIRSGIPKKSGVPSYQIEFINLFSLVGIISLGIFGTLRFLGGEYVGAYFELGVGLAAMLNVIALRRTHNPAIASTVILLLMLIVFDFLIVFGGIHQTGLVWLYTFPPLAFFLKGRRSGFAWVLSEYGLVILLVGLSVVGYIPIAFDLRSIIQSLASLFAVSILIYFYAVVNERYRARIQEESDRLSAANEQLEKTLVQYQKAQQEIETRTKEVERINKIMVDRELKMAELKKEMRKSGKASHK